MPLTNANMPVFSIKFGRVFGDFIGLSRIFGRDPGRPSAGTSFWQAHKHVGKCVIRSFLGDGHKHVGNNKRVGVSGFRHVS